MLAALPRFKTPTNSFVNSSSVVLTALTRIFRFARGGASGGNLIPRQTGSHPNFKKEILTSLVFAEPTSHHTVVLVRQGIEKKGAYGCKTGGAEAPNATATGPERPGGHKLGTAEEVNQNDRIEDGPAPLR